MKIHYNSMVTFVNATKQSNIYMILGALCLNLRGTIQNSVKNVKSTCLKKRHSQPLFPLYLSELHQSHPSSICLKYTSPITLSGLHQSHPCICLSTTNHIPLSELRQSHSFVCLWAPPIPSLYLCDFFGVFVPPFFFGVENSFVQQSQTQQPSGIESTPTQKVWKPRSHLSQNIISSSWCGCSHTMQVLHSMHCQG